MNEPDKTRSILSYSHGDLIDAMVGCAALAILVHTDGNKAEADYHRFCLTSLRDELLRRLEWKDAERAKGNGKKAVRS